MTAVTGFDRAVLATCWRSIGLRHAAVEWCLDRPALLTGSLAMRLRSALGPALAAAGVRSEVLCSIPGHRGPAAAWFRGWDCPIEPARTVRAELRFVAAVTPEWPALRQALARLRLPAGTGSLAATLRCVVRCPDERVPLDSPILDGRCLVETESPLHLTAAGRMVTGPPPFEVLVRSAGERLHQLCRRWGEGAEGLPPVIGRAYHEARGAQLEWARVTRWDEVTRRSSSTGQMQHIRGIRGVFAYDGAGPLAMAVLQLGAQLGVGKDSAFGCGQLRVWVAETS